MGAVSQIENHYDVVIIGGGPAGSVTAMQLADAGRKVLIVERDEFPRHHIGESLSGETLVLLDQLGLKFHLENSGYVKKHGVLVTGKSERSKFYVPVQSVNPDGSLEKMHTWQIRRDEFDHFLLETAKKKGAILLTGSVTDVIKSDRRITGVKIKNENGDKINIPAKLIVDASGQGCFLGRKGILGPSAKTGYEKQIAFYAYAKGVNRDPDNHGEDTHIYYGGKDHWCWRIPYDETITSLGVVVPGALFKKFKKDKDAFFRDQIKSINPVLAEGLSDAEIVSEVRVVRNYSYRYQSITGPGFMALGDAHSFLDPIFSFGVQFAIKEAILAAPHIQVLLDKPDHDLSEYCQKVGKAHDYVRLMIDTFWHYPLAFTRLAHYTHASEIAFMFSGRFFDDSIKDLESIRLMRGLFHQDKVRLASVQS